MPCLLFSVHYFHCVWLLHLQVNNNSMFSLIILRLSDVSDWNQSLILLLFMLYSEVSAVDYLVSNVSFFSGFISLVLLILLFLVFPHLGAYFFSSIPLFLTLLIFLLSLIVSLHNVSFLCVVFYGFIIFYFKLIPKKLVASYNL